MGMAAVCGTGKIGADMATLLIGNGVPTVVIGHSQAGMDRCRNTVGRNLNTLEAEGKLTSSQREAVFGLLSVTKDFQAARGAGIVFEAAAEDLAVKQEVFQKLEAVCAADTIIASTTSALPPSVLCASLRHPERLLVAHPFQPAHMLPLFELVGSEKTSPAALERAKSFLENDLNRQVVCLHREIEGFIVNRIAQAMFRECLFLLEQGVASAADIDKAVHYAIGMRYASIGLLEYFDAVGFDLESSIAQTIYPTLCGTAEVQALVRQGLETGKTGLAAGEGLYRWDAERVQDFELRKRHPYLDILSWNLPI